MIECGCTYSGSPVLLLALLFNSGFVQCSADNRQHKSVPVAVCQDTICRLFSRASVRISRTKAIRIAKRAGYWQQNHWAYGPQITLTDSVNRFYWKVDCYRVGYTEEGTCRYTKGCTLIELFEIWIDAQSGVAGNRRRIQNTIPNDE